MSHFRLSDDYFHRKCYFEREQVPTQTVMKNKMHQLAPVYFKSMIYKLKVLAGLEPPLKGGGADWFQPPEEILNGRHVLTPVEHAWLTKLSFNGVDLVSKKIVMAHFKALEAEKYQVLAENDANWKLIIAETCKQQWDETVDEKSAKNTDELLKAFHQFEAIYKTSINRIESLLMEAAIKEIKSFEDQTHNKMMERYRRMLKYQQTKLYDEYTALLDTKKAELKAQFIKDLYAVHKERSDQVRGLNIEKHTAIEKLRNLLECQKLACQVYVAQKERQECKKEIDLAVHEHKKKIKEFKNEIALQNFEINLEVEKEKKRNEFNSQWKNKICHIVKNFQMFVDYCYKLMPQYADFFINMEKLMLIQLSDASNTPSVQSIIEPEPRLETPEPRPHPYFFFREGGYYPRIQDNLCPKHCTSSASQLPVVIFGKRCMYSACDNIELFTDIVTRYIEGDRGNDIDVRDFHNYENCLPVRVTNDYEIEELRKQSSLMQLLQQEVANVKKVATECSLCKVPHCFCSPPKIPDWNVKAQPSATPSQIRSLPSGSKIETRPAELHHEREPKWESYMEFIHTKKCVCPKTAKKHLKEHLPPYMRIRSKFEAPEVPGYEPITVPVLKGMVRRAKGKRPRPPPPAIPPPRTKEAQTQYEDLEYDFLCSCLSEKQISKILASVIHTSFNAKDGNLSPTFLKESPSEFVIKQAVSLRRILEDEPQLVEIFRSLKCDK